ncbi:MAG: 2-C-methyl-D-erythritol 4-phosphate cytidylyltransferase, partial [Pseudomonadota bacterium]
MRIAILIVAAGKGLRLGGAVPKQYQMIAGEMVLTRTLRAALASTPDLVQVAIHPDFQALYDQAVAPLQSPALLPPVAGGAERAETVRLALEALEPHDPEIVLV